MIANGHDSRCFLKSLNRYFRSRVTADFVFFTTNFVQSRFQNYQRYDYDYKIFRKDRLQSEVVNYLVALSHWRHFLELAYARKFGNDFFLKIFKRVDLYLLISLYFVKTHMYITKVVED